VFVARLLSERKRGHISNLGKGNAYIHNLGQKSRRMKVSIFSYCRIFGSKILTGTIL
jgi:hypothetical protein